MPVEVAPIPRAMPASTPTGIRDAHNHRPLELVIFEDIWLTITLERQ